MSYFRKAIHRLFVLVLINLFLSGAVMAAPYAAVVLDAQNGNIIYERNGSQKLHPASLTKMMTLYIAFSEVEAGRLRLDQKIRISKKAASEPPSKIGLKAGTSMELRYLLRAAAIKSANDAATAIGEAIAGSEENFARYMTQVAKGLGMRNTQFLNAHGLTRSGHYSTAYDMAILGRHLVYDYPRYYNLFSQEYANTPLGNFRNSNIRFLRDYPGADGIKTGYTNAAGYNLVGSAKRGSSRVIVSMFGGQSSYQRNEQIGALLDLGFRSASRTSKVTNLSRIRLNGVSKVASAEPEPAPKPEPAPAPAAPAPAAATVAASTVAAAPRPQLRLAPSSAKKPPSRTGMGTTDVAAMAETIAQELAETAPAVVESAPVKLSTALPAKIERPATRPDALSGGQAVAQVVEDNEDNLTPEMQGDFAIQLAARPSRAEAESYLIATSLAEPDNLGNANTQVVEVTLNGAQMYRPRFSGVNKNTAYDTCSRIQKRNEQCYVIAPEYGG